MIRIFAVVLLTILSSCNSEKDPLSTFQGTAMTMHYRILVGSPLSSKQKKAIQELIDETFSEIDQTFNKWNPQSELSKLNNASSNEKIIITPNLKSLLLRTDQIVKLSQGKFDPTIEPIQTLWKSHLENGTIPDQKSIEELKPAIGWNHIHIDQAYFTKDHPLTEIDLGGIAKGLAVDLLDDRLSNIGFPNHYVEWGGEIRTSGQHPEKRPWRIFISNNGDGNPENAIAILDLEDQAIATSGDYFQYWTVESEGETYTYYHIIDPQTGAPRLATHEGVSSASVVAPTCALADALATVAMLFPTFEEADAWTKKIEESDPSIHFYLSRSAD